MTWTRERPKGVDCVRNYQSTYHPQGARVQIYYRADVSNSPDGTNDASDSWWHPVRADGRYPALPVEDGRKWVREYPAGMTWYSWKDDDGVRRLDRWISEAVGSTSLDDDTWCLPYIAGDAPHTLPPLPSAETPAPLTPAEEATLRGSAFDGCMFGESFSNAAEQLFTECKAYADAQRSTTAHEPLRLEIAARIMAGFAASPDSPACKSTTPEGIEAEQIAYANMVAASSLRWTDALIAAARKGGAS